MDESDAISPEREAHDERCVGLQRGPWAVCLAFVAFTCILFACSYEIQRYQDAIEWELGGQLSIWEQILVIWFLAAKSALLFVPIFPVLAVLAWLRKRGIIGPVLLVYWTLIFSWMVLDLESARITGNHVLDYAPYLYDMVRSPDKKYWNWLGGGIVRQVAAVPVVALGGGLIVYMAVQRGLGWQFLRVGKGKSFTVVLTILFVILLAGTVAGPACFSHKKLLRQYYQVCPIGTETIDGYSRKVARLGKSLWKRDNKQPDVRIVRVAVFPIGRQTVFLSNSSSTNVELKDWRLQNGNAASISLSGMIESGKTIPINLAGSTLKLQSFGDQVQLLDAEGRLRHRVSFEKEDLRLGQALEFDNVEFSPEDSVYADRLAKSVQSQILEGAMAPKPEDPRAVIRKDKLPNVVLFVLESFRASALNPKTMPGIDKWSRSGLRLENHYSGSNCTQMGLFCLLYGRNAVGYNQTLDKAIPPQLAVSLRKSGYRLSTVASGEFRTFRRIDEFVNDRTFDDVFIDDLGTFKDFRDWPEADRRSIFKVSRILKDAPGPHFIMVWLYSTHYPYVFPPEFKRHTPCDGVFTYGAKLRKALASDMSNRYLNAASFLDDELTRSINSLDPQNTIVIVTGDHGESIGEDGVLGHGSLASEIQTRVPFVMVGPGITPRRITKPTSHIDFLPTLLQSLAGKPVNVEHVDGLSAMSAGDQGTRDLVITPWRWWDHKEMVLLRQSTRLLFRVKQQDANLQPIFMGFLDKSGRIK